MTGTGAGVLAVIGLGALAIALARSSGRHLFVVVSGGTLLALLALATLLGHF